MLVCVSCGKLDSFLYENTQVDKYSLKYDIIPKDDPPEAIHWWLTTCNHNPDSNQVAAMRDVSLKFNPKPGGINFLLVIGAITAAGLLIGLMITRKKRS